MNWKIAKKVFFYRLVRGEFGGEPFHFKGASNFSGLFLGNGYDSILGRHGETGWMETVVYGTSEKVKKRAPYSILIIPGQFKYGQAKIIL